MIERYSKIIDALRLIRAVFSLGFTTANTLQFRDAIIGVARQALFPNLQNIVGGIKYMISEIDKLNKA